MTSIFLCKTNFGRYLLLELFGIDLNRCTQGRAIHEPTLQIMPEHVAFAERSASQKLRQQTGWHGACQHLMNTTMNMVI